MLETTGRGNKQYTEPQMEIITFSGCVLITSDCIMENAGGWVNGVDVPAN